MSLQYLDSTTVAQALSCAWKTKMNKSESPEEAPLTSDLTDEAPDAQNGLTLNVDGATYTTESVTVTTATVDNSNGLNSGENDVQMNYTSSATTSWSQATTEAVTAGASFSVTMDQTVTKESASFSVSFTYSSTETETQSSTQSTNESMTVKVIAQDGHIYQVVLIAEVQTLTIPFSGTVRVTGNSTGSFTTSTSANSASNSTEVEDAGTVFGWVASYKCAGSESSAYSDGGNGTGLVAISGTVTISQSVNFTSEVNDVT